MNPRFSFFRLFIIIALATTAYLFYVSEQRKSSVKNNISNPQVNDVYKVELDDEDGERYLHYYRIKEITPEGIVFILSKMKGKNSFDIALKQFDSAETAFYTHRQIKEIVEQKKIIQYNPKIIEIVR
jgi:3-methyladenine DNA glycosylase Tag